jgi:DNA invertase Pin-like site-specific DNA recombinase
MRVSSAGQSTARQLVGIELERVYQDHASGVIRDRPELKRCLDALREGDTLHVHAIDRLSRSMRDLIDIVDVVLKAKANLTIYSPYMQITSREDNYMQEFQLHLWGMIAQLERAMSKQRQKEGIAQAKTRGTRSGKPFGNQPLDMSLSTEAMRLHNEGISNRQIAIIMKLSRPSITKLLSDPKVTNI